MRQSLFCLAVGAALFLSAQEKPPADESVNFTGTVHRLESNIRVRAARIHFEPGARTKWHVHERGQVLLCEEGVARTQVQGHPVQELHPGETAYVPGGVPHWHGAAASQATTLFSVDVSAGQTKWLNAVTDAEYNAAPKR
jgi:quercetin dioxygenase-like cupin family protein